MNGRDRSFRAGVFQTEIQHLGVRGFSDWLTTSFGGNDPRPELGHFHYEEDLSFPDLFRLFSSELSPEALEIGRTAVQISLSEFDRGKGTYAGLYTLAGLAEEFGSVGALEPASSILETWLDPHGPHTRPPQDLDDIMDLRETLESAFRMLMLASPLISTDLEARTHFQRIVNWSHDTLTQRHNARYLIPTWGPMYVMAIAASAWRGASSASLDQRMVGGALAVGDQFEEEYHFCVRGDYYPFNLSRLREARVTYEARFSDQAHHIAAYVPAFAGDPMDRPSATRGDFGLGSASVSEQESERYLEALEAELEALEAELKAA